MFPLFVLSSVSLTKLKFRDELSCFGLGTHYIPLKVCIPIFDLFTNKQTNTHPLLDSHVPCSCARIKAISWSIILSVRVVHSRWLFRDCEQGVVSLWAYWLFICKSIHDARKFFDGIRGV